MIGREEVREFAREFQLDIQVIEKDYVLGWLLAAIGVHPALREQWVFKGGTCLKKCYFETYRFSEDLDFTVLDETQLQGDFLARTFDEVAEWVNEQSGIDLPREARRFEVYLNRRGRPAAEGRVGYRGPHARAGDAPRIKLDLAVDELLVLEPVRRNVHHPYSDAPADGMDVLCYAFDEVFAEKMRALAERQRPRDLYDVIHLHRRADLGADPARVESTLARKCEFKGIPVPTVAALAERPERQAMEVEWDQMLAHQLPVCPPFSEFWSELPRVFDWLTSRERPMPLTGIRVREPAGGLDVAWHAPPMVVGWNLGLPLEAIRFAGANQLLVNLDYEPETGNRGIRTVEPYALRRSKAGDLLLYAVRADTGEVRSYRIDRIRGIEVLRKTFVPRYAIELSTGGVIGSVPDVVSRPAAFTPTILGPARRRPRGRSSGTFGSSISPRGPVYVYQCGYCRKRFSRSSMNGTLKPHKTKQGWDCPGRSGMLVETKY